MRNGEPVAAAVEEEARVDEAAAAAPAADRKGTQKRSAAGRSLGISQRGHLEAEETSLQIERGILNSMFNQEGERKATPWPSKLLGAVRVRRYGERARERARAHARKSFRMDV